MPISLLSEAECEGDGIMVGDIGHSVITVEHLECARAHAFVEDVVDYLLIVVVGCRIAFNLSKSIVGDRLVGDSAISACIAESLLQRVEDGIVGRAVEISREEHGQPLCVDFGNLVDDKQNGILSRFTAYVVEVRVEVVEFLVGAFELCAHGGNNHMLSGSNIGSAANDLRRHAVAKINCGDVQVVAVGVFHASEHFAHHESGKTALDSLNFLYRAGFKSKRCEGSSQLIGSQIEIDIFLQPII